MDKEEQLRQQRERYRIRKEKRANNQKINNAGRPANTPEVLWSKIDVKTEDECWNWKGYKNEDGYGRTWINDCGYYAHRVIYDLVYPNIITLSAPKNTDETGFILHTCDNPSCCNPKHLWVGNCSENIADKVKKGRSADFSGDKGPNCKLSMEQAQEIRQKRKDGISAKELANQYRVSLSSVKTLLAGKSYVPRE
jgi:hypothetical protein